ncbi:hypothetical protein BDP27DRAFT_1316882 [Rhodocollybia butyracea]|uniref:Uncharacterized protein n=1 Tax=Rhodocollybia butyracea TaxID=206335 RepID=A0A9P5Q435_9AGAR|nr:hypothetical protein BDP27DRAFT_1316882 [Rhodocollybia butyracea]
MMIMSSSLLGLLSVFGFVAALPQASVTLPEFIPTTSGQNPTAVVGTEWAQPIGTASDGSATTFIVENVFTETGLVGTGVLTTVTTTGIETVAVSASGWEQDNFFSTITGTILPGGVHCFFTASSSGECDKVQVADDGTTATMTLTGDLYGYCSAILDSFGPSSPAASTSSTPNAASALRSGFDGIVSVIVVSVVGGITLGVGILFI